MILHLLDHKKLSQRILCGVCKIHLLRGDYGGTGIGNYGATIAYRVPCNPTFIHSLLRWNYVWHLQTCLLCVCVW